MIKWLKRKIEIHNNNLDYDNYENHWEFGEWIYFVLIAFFFPIGLSIFICYIENSWLPFFVGVNITVIIEYGLCCQIELFSKNTNKIQDIEEEFDPYRIDNIQFIWGIKSWDDFTSSDPNLHTMNDLDITYDYNTKLYYLDIESIYHFKEGKAGEIKYLNRLLKEFTKYMKENNLNINDPYDFWVGGQILLRAKTIPELYTQFRIFVEGYNVVYGGVENETVCDI
jgi:hypothetical protein